MDNKNIVINAANFHQSVYVFRCERSTITVKGKVNFIALGDLVHYVAVVCVSLPPPCR